MTLYEFKALDPTLQSAVLTEKGVQIGERKVDDYIVFLYQVENFYVEVVCSNDLQVSWKYQSFKSLERLNPYLEEIDISSLTDI